MIWAGTFVSFEACTRDIASFRGARSINETVQMESEVMRQSSSPLRLASTSPVIRQSSRYSALEACGLD